MMWTQEMDVAITRGYEQGLSARLIGEQLGVTRNSVLGRTFRLGLCQPPDERRQPIVKAVPKKVETLMRVSVNRRVPPDQIIDRITDLIELGLKWREIAGVIGVSPQTVRSWAVRYGGYTPRRMVRFTDEDRAYIHAAWERNDLLEDIADKLGRSFGVIKQEIHRLQKAGVIGSRDPIKTRLLRQYGEEALAAGATPSEALKKIAEAKEIAFASAMNAARTARQKIKARAIAAMHESIAAGKDRNACIFSARAEGVTLEELGTELGVTRERIRQICNARAQVIALDNLLTSKSEAVG